MEFDFQWLYKFFTYSSIQVKFISSFLAILIFIIIRRVIVGIIYKRIDDSLVRYRWQKTATYIVYALALITVGRVWFKGIESIATYLGLLSAGVAIALKDPITNITAWMFILWRSPFTVGDRIEIGKDAGDVIDVKSKVQLALQQVDLNKTFNKINIERFINLHKKKLKK